MPYKIIEHPSDFQIRATGKDLEELFSGALKGMEDFLEPASKPTGPSVKRAITLAADNPTVLLVDFLSQALLLSQINKEIYSNVSFGKINGQELACEIIGTKVSRFKDDIKAVTHHLAGLKKNGQGLWETDILFDI